MKKTIVSFCLLLLAIAAVAQAPQAVNYQGILRNASGLPIANHSAGFRFSILQASASGTAVYVETQSTTTNASGLFVVNIGLGTAVTGIFSTIDWANGPYFIKVEYDTTGNKNYLALSTTQILSVPYALYANNSEHSDKSDSTSHADSAVHCIKCDTTNYSHHSDTALVALTTVTNSHSCLDTLSTAGIVTITDTTANIGGQIYYSIIMNFTPAFMADVTDVNTCVRAFKNGAYYDYLGPQGSPQFLGQANLGYIKASLTTAGDVMRIEILVEHMGCKKMFVHTRTL